MDLDQHLTDFVATHPDGWSHAEWLDLLDAVERDGNDASDREQIGMALETARLRAFIERCGVKGMGPKRTAAVADHCRTLWNFRHATAEEVADVPSMNRALAERLLAAR